MSLNLPTHVDELPSADTRLVHFLLVNDPLPDDLFPILDSHLDRLGRSIATIVMNIQALEGLLAQYRLQRDVAEAEKKKWNWFRAVRCMPLEIVAHIIRCTLRAISQDGRVVKETDPLALMNLRLVSRAWNEAAIASPDLWRSVHFDLLRKFRSGAPPMPLATWTSRSGELVARRHLALTGDMGITSGDVEERGARLRGVVVDGVKLLLCQPWTRWRLGSSIFSALVIAGGGLSNLLKIGFDGEKSKDLLSPSEAFAALQEFSVVGWVDFKLFSSVEDASAFSNLRSLMLSQTLNRGVRAVQGHFPPSLRYLHLAGAHQYHSHIIFAIAQLEELIFSCSDFTPCRFETPFLAGGTTASKVLNTSLRRLSFQGSRTVAWCFAVLECVTLPSLELLSISRSTVSIMDQWTEYPEALPTFLERSSPADLCLSMEHSIPWSRAELQWVLYGLYGRRIKTLYVDTVASVLKCDADLLQDLALMVESVASHAVPRSDEWGTALKVLQAREAKVALYLPKSEDTLPSELTRIFEVQHLSVWVLYDLFEHDFQGHEYDSLYYGVSLAS
ncbi:hypothetical protein BKA70DRAFT_1279257 [Coprinopsis sp. MPI-PUGE-AT-0042]|nr:hypothetical protein BKA70DRAFT_1279257 [Coprinopsis sp. MPI-PUGE-AT-0042]